MTNELRRLIYNVLQSVDGLSQVYYGVADENAMYPHAVFDLRSVSLLGNDLNRRDFVLVIDVWNKGTSETEVLNLCDAIDDVLNAANMPQTNILPTFFTESRTRVPDDDKKIKHEALKFTVQVFKKGA